jgi:hypothetical protein
VKIGIVGSGRIGGTLGLHLAEETLLIPRHLEGHPFGCPCAAVELEASTGPNPPTLPGVGARGPLGR